MLFPDCAIFRTDEPTAPTLDSDTTPINPPVGPKEKAPHQRSMWGLRIKNLAVTYFHMGKPHTIIGDAPFHF